MRIQAKVKFYNKEKGFGFFKRANHPDVFFASKALDRAGLDNAKQDELFEFDLTPIEGKGGKATNLKKLDAKEPQ